MYYVRKSSTMASVFSVKPENTLENLNEVKKIWTLQVQTSGTSCIFTYTNYLLGKENYFLATDTFFSRMISLSEWSSAYQYIALIIRIRFYCQVCVKHTRSLTLVFSVLGMPRKEKETRKIDKYIYTNIKNCWNELEQKSCQLTFEKLERRG